MKSPCNTCGHFLLCPNSRICAAWFWWFSDRWREMAEFLRTSEIEEDDEFGEWWE